MILCMCNAVTEADVQAEIIAGARTEDQISERCGAGADCGSCVEKICAVLRSTVPECESVSLAVA
jgi:bacterioferritin-associated ferredoxin